MFSPTTKKIVVSINDPCVFSRHMRVQKVALKGKRTPIPDGFANDEELVFDEDDQPAGAPAPEFVDDYDQPEDHHNSMGVMGKRVIGCAGHEHGRVGVHGCMSV